VVNMTSAEGVCNNDYHYYCHFCLDTPLMVTGIKIVLITSCLTVTLILESYGALIIYYVIMPGFAQNIDFFCIIFFRSFWELDLLFVFHLFHMHKLAPSCDHFVCHQRNKKILSCKQPLERAWSPVK